MKPEKIKIGTGFYQSGYGRGFKKGPVIWKINGKAYARSSDAMDFRTDLPGFIMVNSMTCGGGVIKYYEIGLVSEHQNV